MNFVSGANTGIGYEAVKALLRSETPYHIILAGRNLEKAQTAAKTAVEETKSKSTVEPVQLDLESDESINDAFKRVSSKHDNIDCLINNAGWPSQKSCQENVIIN
jgi:short-subunit dehydrogenase